MIPTRDLILGPALALAAVVILLGSLLTASVEAEMSPAGAGGLPQPCAPEGWIVYIVREGDQLAGLAAAAGLSPEAILTANCLESLPPAGAAFYLPPSAYSSADAPDCGPPEGWQLYAAEGAASLEELALRLGVTYENLLQANCLEPGTQLRPGTRIFAPVTATPQPSPTAIPTFTPETAEAGATATP